MSELGFDLSKSYIVAYGCNEAKETDFTSLFKYGNTGLLKVAAIGSFYSCIAFESAAEAERFEARFPVEINVQEKRYVLALAKADCQSLWIEQGFLIGLKVRPSAEKEWSCIAGIIRSTQVPSLAYAPGCGAATKKDGSPCMRGTWSNTGRCYSHQ